MKLAIILLFLSLNLHADLGEVGRYQVKIRTTQGVELNLFMTIGSYDKLETAFSSNTAFKEFIFNIRGLSDIDSLTFYKKFYFIKYPQYPSRKENLTWVLDKDFIKLAKSDIETMQYISFQKTDHTGLANKLNFDEIKLLQTKPEFISTYSIDAYEEGYSDEWIISYNPMMKEPQIKAVLTVMKQEYLQSTIYCTQNDKSWIYPILIDKWCEKLKIIDVFLIRVIAP